MERSLIVGIDPGATLAYCALDLSGEPVVLSSSKTARFDEMLKALIGVGQVLAVGTDKAKTPALVSRLAVKAGAVVLSPPEDLKTQAKRHLAQKIPAKNAHELDAAASAVFAFNELAPLIAKVRRHTEGWQPAKARALERLVFVDGISIAEATLQLNRSPPERVEEGKPLELSPLQRRIGQLHERIQQLKDQLVEAHEGRQAARQALADSRRALEEARARSSSRAERAYRLELEAMVNALMPGQRIIPVYADLDEWRRGAHPFRLGKLALIKDQMKVMRQGKQIPAQGAIKRTSQHLAIIDPAALVEEHLIETIVQQYRREHERQLVR